MKMLSVTLKSFSMLSSWYTQAIPAFAESFGFLKCCTTPSTRTLPSSAACTPVRHLISVDFPAPFSPIRPWISPGLMCSSMLLSALTPGKIFVTFCNSTTYSLMGNSFCPNAKIRPIPFFALCCMFHTFPRSTMHREICRHHPDGTPQSPSSMSSLLLKKVRLSVTMLILL